MESNLFPHVGLLSSAARIPFPSATMNVAILEGRGDRRIRRDSGSASVRARHYVRLLDLRLHRLQPVRRKGARGTRGHGRNAARHGLREPAVYPTAEAIPPEALHAHAAQPGRPPGGGSSFPHSTASDEKILKKEKNY